MRKLLYIVLLATAAIVSTGCKADLIDSLSTDRGTVTFMLSGITADVEERSKGSAGTFAADDAETVVRPLKHVWYAILDQNDKVIIPVHHFLSEDLSRMVVEGLYPGKYAVVFMATSESEYESTIPQTLLTIEDKWLTNSVPSALLDKEYFYKRIDFTVDEGGLSLNIPIALTRLVGLLKVQMDPVNVQSTRYIRKVEVLFDEASSLYTTFSANNTYSGEGKLSDLDASEQRNFYSLPTRTPLGGIVRISSEKVDGSTFVRDYPFSGVVIAAGKVSVLNVKYEHPEDFKGYFTVPVESYTRHNSMTMFMENEPKSVFYDEQKRSFYVNEPLKHYIDSDHRLHLQLYSPFTAKNVKIMIRFKNHSKEFFELAHYDEILPFHESWMELPIVSRDCLFKTADGREVLIPAYPNLSSRDCDLKIVTEDPFITKMTAVNSHWFIRFSPYSADSQPSSWQHMTPYLCRHACAMMLNMAYMFSTQEFSDALDKYDGILKDDAQNPINLATLRRTIAGRIGFVMGRVSGVGGLGGGQVYGLMQECYLFVYVDATAPNSEPHSYERMAMFHEFGHCLDYGHDSNMTFGDQWTVLCANVLVAQGRRGELPVCSKHAVGNLPLK